MKQRFTFYLRVFAIVLVSPPSSSAHDINRIELRIFNFTSTEGNMCVNGLRVRRQNLPIPTQPNNPNVLCEDDVLQRVTDPKRLVVVWFLGALGSTHEGKGAVRIIRLAEMPIGYRYPTWGVEEREMIPMDQLVQKTHNQLQLLHGDFAFEPAVEINNYSSETRHILLNGKNLGSGEIPAGENCAISRVDVAGIGKRFTATLLYGKGQRVDGGRFHIYETAAIGPGLPCPAFTTTDADTIWDAESQYPAGAFTITVENQTKQWNAVVLIRKQPLATVAPGNKFAILEPALRGPSNSVTVNIVYTGAGTTLGGEFRVYWKRREGQVEIGPLQTVASDGTSKPVSSIAPDLPPVPAESLDWKLTSD